MALASGATINGRKPLPGATVQTEGVRVADAASSPKASQVAGAGATDSGTGKHIPNPGESAPALAGPNSGVISTGTTAEEQRKRLTMKMYPSASVT